MITTPLEINTFYDIRECVAHYDITPINPEKWKELDGYDAIEDYYDLYHPNVVFTGEIDFYELELGKIEGKNFVVIYGEDVYEGQSTVHVIELPMPTKIEEQKI